MAEASRRASRVASRGGRPNAIFVLDAVERLPVELTGFADRVTVRFPWGSLLRGAVGLDTEMTAAIARLVADGGSLEITLSLTSRDAAAGVGVSFEAADIDRARSAFGRLGLRLVDACQIGRDEVLATSSSWARRLSAGSERPAWHLRFERDRPTA